MMVKKLTKSQKPFKVSMLNGRRTLNCSKSIENYGQNVDTDNLIAVLHVIREKVRGKKS